MNKMIKKGLTTIEAENLLEKYYEGATTVEEERQLQQFLSQKDLPLRFEADQAILGYFAESRPETKKQASIVSFIRWSSVAATLLVGFFLAKFLFSNQVQLNYAYVNGQKITNIKEIKAQAMASLQIIASSPDEVQASTRDLNNNEIINQELAVFSSNH
ncbi:hypothetical protein [Microbacter margulisiae]|uniref:Uncharacterized protein n=1 Tax=Microbacter margulisiae TaxID=1350067 RepID=A0A7W5DRM3_9PORP|nr:hypothetical protein [Microbacter margulisiae]MBB3187299.1 hypothetical protein [Microbacter margulisiae]